MGRDKAAELKKTLARNSRLHNAIEEKDRRIEQLEAIQTLAQAVIHAVEQTEDHPQWFKSIAELREALNPEEST